MAVIYFPIKDALTIIDKIIGLNLALSCHFNKRAEPNDDKGNFKVRGDLAILRQLQKQLLENQITIGKLVET
ncbi:hypothetical protein ACFL2U_00615 [Patescibacteria group bacterium]